MSLESGYTATLVIHHPAGDIKIACDTWDDGNLDSPETAKRNANTRKVTARGGLATRGALTLSAECDIDLWSKHALIDTSVGIDRVTAIRQMVDGRGTVVSSVTRTLTGVLKSAKIPNYALEGEAVGMAEFEVTTDQDAS